MDALRASLLPQGQPLVHSLADWSCQTGGGWFWKNSQQDAPTATNATLPLIAPLVCITYGV